MELGSINRELFIEAAPEVVFEVISSPEHVRRWWPDEARYEVRPGSVGEIVFGDPDSGGAVVGLAVVEVEPPRTFSFRWTQPAGQAGVEGDSLLVTFALEPTRGGTLLKMTETGFREMGWDAAVLEHQHGEHVAGWDHFLPRLASYVAESGVRA